MGWLDLHMHSKHSDDGEFSPEEIISLCLKNGVHTAALTDHNTTDGVADAQYWADKKGITLVPGIELDCLFEGISLHVLGYWIDPTYEEFQKITNDVSKQEKEAGLRRIQLVNALGIVVNTSDAIKIANHGILTGEVIAEVALANKENEYNPLLLPYREGGKRSDNPYVNFYWDICSMGKPAYVPVQYIGLDDAILHIKNAGGVAVLAHPGNNIHEDEKMLSAIVSRGVCGVEAFSSYHSQKQNAFYNEQAQKLGIAMTCGSDFHGKTKPSITIGSVDCGGIEEEMFCKLRNQLC